MGRFEGGKPEEGREKLFTTATGPVKKEGTDPSDEKTQRGQINRLAQKEAFKRRASGRVGSGNRRPKKRSLAQKKKPGEKRTPKTASR